MKYILCSPGKRLNRSFLGKRKISTGTKLTTYNSTYFPTLLPVNVSLGDYLIVAEYRLRKCVTTGESSVRHIETNLQVQPLNERIHETRWFGHVVRMPDHMFPKQIW